MFSIKALAIVKAVKGCFMGRKWPYLLNLSMTTNMVSKLWDFGDPSIKSKEMLVQA
jgi:hypothetical protein